MCWRNKTKTPDAKQVSVAGCLGYDVLGNRINNRIHRNLVSVAGCLGYDVLVNDWSERNTRLCFSCWLFRL